MPFINIKKYLEKTIEIDCIDIEMTRFNDTIIDQPLFKGPGIIKIDQNGEMTYKILNQIPANEKQFFFLKSINESETDNKDIICRINAVAYDGIKWLGAWTIPHVETYSGLSHLLITGSIDNLSTHVSNGKIKEETSTEVFFVNYPPLPYDGNLKIIASRGDEVIFVKHKHDHQTITFEDKGISFVEDVDGSYLQIIAKHTEVFSAPYVENWIVEALTISTGKPMYPRAIIRHNGDLDIVFIRTVRKNIPTSMIQAFPTYSKKENEFWNFFCAYLKKLEQIHQFDNFKLTTGFYEVCLAGRGTLQNFLTAMSIYIESCVELIFDEKDDEIKKESIQLIINAVKKCNLPTEDASIKDRALGLLSMLNSPATAKRIRRLRNEGVITEKQMNVWKSVRPKLAHGEILDFDKQEEFLNYKNHLMCMMYRLIFKIINYNGFALDYDENSQEFKYVKYEI